MSYLGENIRKLGFGLMRLPQTDGVIDVEQTKEMVDLFMDAGFTYFFSFFSSSETFHAIHRFPINVNIYPKVSN